MIKIKEGSYYKVDNKIIILVLRIMEKVVKLRFIKGSTIFSKEKTQTIKKEHLLNSKIIELTSLEVELL
jgi:hypothetical protein